MGNLVAITAFSNRFERAENSRKEHLRETSCDEEMAQMLAEVDLLSFIQQDAGEQGRRCGDRIDFASCPVCDHKDCFRYYAESNSWCCFGESNKTGYYGGTALEYYKATRRDDDVEAVKWLRDETGHPYEAKNSATKSSSVKERDRPSLPPWENARASNPPKRKPPLIHGILRRGHIMLLAGKGKGSKTWSAMELSVAVAMGGEWFGFKCEQGNVLFIDPEMDRRSAHGRLNQVAANLEWADPKLVDDRVKIWSLRGITIGSGDPPMIDDLADYIERECFAGDFSLIVIDSASCFLRGEENSAGDIRRFFAQVHRICEATDAAVLVVHHMGKGGKGDVDSIERSRGSSVFGDAPDAPLSLIEIFPPSGKPSDYLEDGERAFVLEDSGLREFPGIEPQHVIFSYPIHRLDVDGTTDDWKPRSGQSDGGKSTGAGNKTKSKLRARECELALAGELIRRGLPEDGISAAEAAEIVSEKLGETVNPQTLKKYVGDSDVLQANQLSSQRWCAGVKSELMRSPPSSQLSADLSD